MAERSTHTPRPVQVEGQEPELNLRKTFQIGWSDTNVSHAGIYTYNTQTVTDNSRGFLSGVAGVETLVLGLLGLGTFAVLALGISKSIKRKRG